MAFAVHVLLVSILRCAESQGVPDGWQPSNLTKPPVDRTEAWVPTRACWKDAMCKDNSECKFEGDGIDCGIEVHTQELVWRYVPKDATVLEMGARFGTVSCSIAKVQRYSGLRLSLEPDPRAFASLEKNTHREGCAGMNVNGVSSHKNHTWRFAWLGGYASQIMTRKGDPDPAKVATADAPAVTVVGYTVAQLSNFLSGAVNKHVEFDTIVADCEKCFSDFMAEERVFMKSPSLKRIVYELDERSDAMVKLICSYGFGVAYDGIDSMLPTSFVAKMHPKKLLRQVVFTREATTCI